MGGYIFVCSRAGAFSRRAQVEMCANSYTAYRVCANSRRALIYGKQISLNIWF